MAGIWDGVLVRSGGERGDLVLLIPLPKGARSGLQALLLAAVAPCPGAAGLGPHCAGGMQPKLLRITPCAMGWELFLLLCNATGALPMAVAPGGGDVPMGLLVLDLKYQVGSPVGW